ncbi:hypothetical protein MAPG_10135 [Magnaporthiopsis poae ATCC 64411]|uniref:SGNH hydrolase-type esterase domain-containing protein n=1 Tax=Magnaporthiopsis poae (strain ATCC 64411 / 73-15) TaxID=644358 RepID=A0A0C4EBS8_MAGP6|nr:hypothetical protein MAPG_10135 [Magnaporthiopsis poae ATCC 64411]
MGSNYDQFILFGDSIIQHSNSQERGFGLTPALQQEFVRRLDVVNRGFSGYNTVQALHVLPRIMPDPKLARVRFMAIMFGANDACLASAQNGQHVPLDEYKQNLAKLIRHPAVAAHSPRLILVTPPPVEERRLEAQVKSQGYAELNRTNECTKQYADAAREVAKELGVACLDLWSAFMARAGWRPGEPLPGSIELPENDALRALLHDGLHLSPEAYRVFFEKAVEVIAETWPDQISERLPYVYPAWDDADAWAAVGLHMGGRDVVRHE